MTKSRIRRSVAQSRQPVRRREAPQNSLSRHCPKMALRRPRTRNPPSSLAQGPAAQQSQCVPREVRRTRCEFGSRLFPLTIWLSPGGRRPLPSSAAQPNSSPLTAQRLPIGLAMSRYRNVAAPGGSSANRAKACAGPFSPAILRIPRDPLQGRQTLPRTRPTSRGPSRRLVRPPSCQRAEELPREIETIAPKQEACPDFGGTLRSLGEDSSEVLQYIPARFKGIRTVRPKLSCACCSRIVE